VALQHRPLLDVDLAVAQQPLALARCASDVRRRAGEVAQRRSQRHAVVVDELEQRGLEAPGHGAAAEVGRAVPQPLLVAEAQDVDREGQPRALGAQALDARHGGEHPERPVERARVADGVQVRAEQQRPRRGVRAREPADEVARGVDAHLEASRGHPIAHQRVGPRHRRRGEAARQAPRLLAHRGELAAARHDLCRGGSRSREGVHGRRG
jgi:hypothetical protein